MSIPTLDGMTPDQFTDICVGAAMIRLRAEFESNDMPWEERFEALLELGAQAGVVVTFSELKARGLLEERP